MTTTAIQDVSAATVTGRRAVEAGQRGIGREGRVTAESPGRAPAGDSTVKLQDDGSRIVGTRDSSQSQLQVSVEEHNRVIVRIVDASGNLIRQLPPEEVVELARRLDKVIGILFDEKA